MRATMTISSSIVLYLGIVSSAVYLADSRCSRNRIGEDC